MATTHKTYAGMIRAAERLIAQLEAGPIADDREYREMDRKSSAILRELGALWSNPADAAEAEAMRGRVRDAWNRAIM